jgi:AraC-like DNA-binding protein
MHLTLKSALLGIGVVQGLFLAGFLILARRGRPRANRMLGLFVLAFSLLTVGDIALDTRAILVIPDFLFCFAPLMFALAPLAYFYVAAVTVPQWRITPVRLLHFLPTAMMGALVFLMVLVPEDLKQHAVTEALAGTESRIDPFMVAAVVQILVYAALTMFLLRRHTRRVDQFFSSHYNVSLLWLKVFIVMNTTVGIAFTLATIFRLQAVIDASDLLFPLLVYVMGYFGLAQPEIFSDLDVVHGLDRSVGVVRDRYAASGLGSLDRDSIASSIATVMKDQRPFLKGDLTLPELAARTGHPLYKVSQVINEHFGVSFSTFINGYRVEEFKRRLADPRSAHLTILAVGFESGFNSKAAMNRVFKAAEGVSPSSYRASLISGDAGSTPLSLSDS